MMDVVDETLKLWRRTAFDYGQADCLLSIGDYIARRGGTDIAARFRGTYSTEEEALALVASYGGPNGLIDLTGLPPIDPALAGRGDVLVLDTGSGDAGCIGALCTGPGVAARLERGVIEVNRRLVPITHAWKVG